jgi:hypothetical protein
LHSRARSDPARAGSARADGAARRAAVIGPQELPPHLLESVTRTLAGLAQQPPSERPLPPLVVSRCAPWGALLSY